MKPAPGSEGKSIIVIEARTFLRECIVHCITASKEIASVGTRVFGVASIEEALKMAAEDPTSLILVSALGYATPARFVGLIDRLRQVVDVPIAVLADNDDPELVSEALEMGANGYIHGSTPFKIGMRALALIHAGGTFVPASCLLNRRQGAALDGSRHPKVMFTTRQAAVAEALSKGKANKVIARELGIQESTVKVHVRKIMHSLKVNNRTEVALILARTNKVLA